jgi:hypothetical protein
MSFRRDGKSQHDDQFDWEAWTRTNANLLNACGLPLGVLRSRRDWKYLLRFGYWCKDYYGSHVGNIDFQLSELNEPQTAAFRQLLDRTLTDDEKQRGCAAWHHVQPPSGG